MPYLTASSTDVGLTIAVVLAPALIVPLAWHAAHVAPPDWRRFAWLALAAFGCQVAAGLAWCVAYLAGGQQAPSAPGIWTPLLYFALLAASAATCTAVRNPARPNARLRDPVLDYVTIVAALACVAVATFDRELADHWALIDATLRSLVGLLLVVLIASATWGRWPGGHVPVALFGLGIAAYVLCSASAAIAASGIAIGTVLPGALWMIAALCAMLVLLGARRGIDRRVGIGNSAIPGVSPIALTLWSAAAWTVAAGTGLYGALAGDVTVLIVALAALSWIGLTGMARAVGALRTIRSYYLELDETLFLMEQASDRAKLANRAKRANPSRTN